MEIHEEFRIKINDTVKSWCYYPPLDAIVYEGTDALTIIEAGTGCINKTFSLTDSLVRGPICVDVVGKQKLAIACGNVFNCRSKFNDVILCDSILQTSSDYSDKCCIDLPMPEALMLLEALKTVSAKWEYREKLGFECSLDLEQEDSSDNVWKWNLVTFNCPSTILFEWLTDINMEMSDNFPSLPLISSILYRIKCLQMSDYEIRLSIYDRFKEVMNIEANRFLSFEMWPHKTYKWATPELMAKVGFYHHPRRKYDDRALCFLCNICLITWEATDEPWSEHQRHSPSCPLFKQNYTSNVPLSLTEATTTAQKQNSSNNITIIAKSTGNRYVATISEDGHICIWDTCYLFRKIIEFDTPVLSKDGSITIDSACLIDNPLLIKSLPNETNDENFQGFHIVLGARFVPDSDVIYKYIQQFNINCLSNDKAYFMYNQQPASQESAFLIVIDVAYQFSLISKDEKNALPDYSFEDYRLNINEDMPFDDPNEVQSYPDGTTIVYKQESPSNDEQVNVNVIYSFFNDLSLARLWHESKSASDSTIKSRDLGDTTIIQIVPLVLDVDDNCQRDCLKISSIHPIVIENDDDSYESDAGSSVYLMVNIHRDADNNGDGSVAGALSVYKFQVDGVKDSKIKPNIKLQQMSSTLLSANEQVENMFPISFESLESNCSESSSTANADEIQTEPLALTKTPLNKSSLHWLLLTNSNGLFLYTLPLNQVSLEPIRQPISEIAIKINIKKELTGNIKKLLLFSDMDRLSLLTDDGVMAFYTIVPRKKIEQAQQPIHHVSREKSGEIANDENRKPILTAPITPIIPDPLIVEQDDIVDRLNLVCDFIQYEIVTSRLKLTYGCNWVEVSPLEIIDFKASNVNNFINVSRCFTSKTGLQSDPPFITSGSPYMKVSDQQQCCTRTLNFRSSHASPKEQIIEFSTAKQLCLGHVDLRFELYEKMNKNSNLVYITLLRQQKFNGSNSSKEHSAGSLKVNTSSEANMIINDLEAPFIDDDMAQYYDELNADILRKLDGEIVAGPYLLNKYCQSDSTSVFLSMTSAELIKCRSRHYAIHIRTRYRGSTTERKQSNSPDRYSTSDASSLNIKSISLTLRKFSKPVLSIRNERSQRLAILRNHKFLQHILDLLVEKLNSKIARPLMLQNCFDIFNWILVMYLNDTKPHSEKIHRIISISTEYVRDLILIHLVQGDRYTSKMMSKILNGLIKLESRYWSLDNRADIGHESTYFVLSRSIHHILQSNIDWLLLSENSVAVHNYLLILDNLDQLFLVQQSGNTYCSTVNSSLPPKLNLLAIISQRYSEIMNTDENKYLRTILGYPHNPMTGELFDIVTNDQSTEPVNTLYWNMTEMYNKRPAITLDCGNNDSISKYLMHTFHDHSIKHIQGQLNEQIHSIEEKLTTDFSIQELQKVYHKMVMTNISNNIQLMSPDTVPGTVQPTIKLSDTPEPAQASNISNMTWPGFDPFLLSKMNHKQLIYSDIKKKLKTGYPPSTNTTASVIKTNGTPIEHAYYKLNCSRKSSILEVDVLPIYFESGSEGTFLETSDFSDQLTKDATSINCDEFSPNITIPLMHMMDGSRGLPATPKTTPAITTQTTPMQNSPVQSPLTSVPVSKPEIIETSSLLMDDINQQRLKFSQHTNNLLTNSCSYYIVVNRLHANARRHVILDLHQASLITDIIIPSSDKLQKIIIRVGRTKNEEEMQTVVVHSKIATEPLQLLNIQPKIMCNFVQVIVIAKSNITATRNRVNIGHFYGRAAILPWETLNNELAIPPVKNWYDSVIQMLDQLRPQTETISIRYTMARETLKHLLNKCLKTGINQHVLSHTTYEHHPNKTKLPEVKPVESLVQLINHVNNAYNKCCQLQQHLSSMNNQMKQLQTLLSMADPDYRGHQTVVCSQHLVSISCVDKMRVLMEFLLESLLLDKTLFFDIDSLKENIGLLSQIMSNAMWFGNREMQIMIVSWIPKLLTKSNNVSQAIEIWCRDWLMEFLMKTFTNRNASLSSLNKEEIFSFICVIFQRLSNSGYHYQLLENTLEILIVMLQPSEQEGKNERYSIDIELLNWVMLFMEFILSWIDNNSINQEEQFTEWKFLFWNKTYNSVDDQPKSNTVDGTKDKMTFLKQTLTQLNSQKEVFVEFIKKCQYDSWFSQLIMAEYMGHYDKLSYKLNSTIAKLKKSLSVSKSKKPIVKMRTAQSSDIDPLITTSSTSIATTIKLMLKTLQCMDFQVSQDTFILTCMILTKLFALAHHSCCDLNDYIEKESIYSLIERSFKQSPSSTIGLDVYSLHACKLLLSEIVFRDIRTLAINRSTESRDELRGEISSKMSVSETNQEDNVVDSESVDNDDEDEQDNEEEDITPTGADDEEIANNPDEPYTFYITHLGNIGKQKENIKNNEESPSDEYVDIVEEFDFLGQPTSFIPTYHKAKLPKDYQSTFKPLELDRQISANAMDATRPEKQDLDSSHSILYYDLRLENTIFSHQEIMFNHSILNWMHNILVQLYSQIPPCPPVENRPSTIGRNKTLKPLSISYVLESINRLLDDFSDKINLEELVIFISNICHHLQKESLLGGFDSMDICVVSLETLLDKILQKCSQRLFSLTLYCQLICFLLEFNDYTLKQCHFQRIFQLTDSLQCQELTYDVIRNFRIIVTKSLENVENNAHFFLEILYNIVENCHRSPKELRASGQLASVIMECSKSKVVECIQENSETFSKFISRTIALTKLYLSTPDTVEERKCFTSLVPKRFTRELLQIEKCLIWNSSILSQTQSTALMQLNLLALEIIKKNEETFLDFVDMDMLRCLFETLSGCSSNILENSKLGDVTMVSEDLVRYSQNTSIGDIVWRQLVRIAHAIISTSHHLATELLNSLFVVLQQSLPAINEPLFLVSIWLLKNLPHPDDIDYSQLLTTMMSVIVCCTDSRLSNSPMNTVTTCLAVAKMHRYNSPQIDQINTAAVDGNISNSSRLNVAPYCKIYCWGNDSSDPGLLARLLANHPTKSSITTLRSNRLKPADLFWSYDFFPHETSVELVITLPCDMIIHKIILHPKSFREFSPRFELTIIRDSRDTATTTYQQIHRPVSHNDGILIDNINSNQLVNKLVLRFEKPISGKLAMSKMEIFTINQWWDHRFQVANDESNLCVFRCLHLFNYLIGITSTSTTTFINEILPTRTKFFNILLNWNHVSSSSSSSELVEIRMLNKSICGLIERICIQLGERLELFSSLFISEMLAKVSLRPNQCASTTEHNIQFTHGVSMMELNIFYNLLTAVPCRLMPVLEWLEENVLQSNTLIYHDSVAAIVYLLAIVVWHHNRRDLLTVSSQFIVNLQRSIVESNGYLKKSLCRLLCSVCAVQPSFFVELLDNYSVLSAASGKIDQSNLKSVLWASKSPHGSRSLRDSGLLSVLIDRINLFLTSTVDFADPYQIFADICSILKFLAKLCVAGGYAIKRWLGTAETNTFWPLLLDYLINDGHYLRDHIPMALKMKLINASVKFFRAVTLCNEPNQTAFVRIFIDSMERYRARSDTIVLSNSLRQLILDVIVKEPVYNVVINMSEPNHLFKPFPGWMISSDELGRSRLSFRHPCLGYESNCILIEKLPMTDTVASLLADIYNRMIKPKPTVSSDSESSNESRIFSRQSSSTVNIKPKRQSIIGADAIPAVSLSYRQRLLSNELDIFDLVTFQESEEQFTNGYIQLTCAVDQAQQASLSIGKAVSNGYLLVKFTEHGGLKLLSSMLPLLYTDIRRVSSISGTTYRPTTSSLSNSMGFIDDEIVAPTEVNRVVKSLPLIPAHSITALCLFLHIDLYPQYLIRQQQFRSALIHLLLGIIDDDCGVSLIQTYPQLQYLPFVILSDLLQDPAVSSDKRAVIVTQCLDLGLIDFFINLLSILGHIDSGLSLNSFRSTGPWSSFLSQSLSDLHYQLFSPVISADKSSETRPPVSGSIKPGHMISSSMDPKSPYITFMPFIDEKKNYWAKGTGFGTGGMYSTWDSEYVLLRQRLEETNASAILDTLSTFISPSDDDDAVDILREVLDHNDNTLPTKAVESIYQSSLLSFVCCYLRNDSVLDVSQHVSIYKSVLRLIRAIAKHRCLHYILFPHLNPVGTNPQFIYSLNQSSSLSSVNVSQLLFQLKICVDTYINRLKKAPGATAGKSSENTRRLTRQLSIRRKNTNYSSFLQRINDALKNTKDGATDTKDDQKGAESENLTLLIPEINGTLKLLEEVELDIYDRNKKHESANAYLSDLYGLPNGDYGINDDASDHIDVGKTVRDIESKYMELMKKLQFGMFEMISPVSDEGGKVKFTIPYHFKKNVENAVTSQSSAASLSRARRLAQETVTLSTSLPLSYSSSVFVRCDENHLDIMKVIIVGPPETPYANGCFEFDVYFPPDYPKTPPLLNLQTTGNGSVRFNPNLYNEGKVCLSILNTWHGRPEERWSNRTSSFLQVLVSIQSLILVSEPYFNEPGYERSRGTPSGNNASKAYSANIQAATSRWAILEMMKNPPICFAEVIKKHFLLKKEEILAQMQSWIDIYVDPSFDPALFNNTRPSIANSVQNLKKNFGMIKKEYENLEKEDLLL